jgi:RNA polymerase sigma factor (sigma-70 family)
MSQSAREAAETLSDEASFESFAESCGKPLRHVLIARYGLDVGPDVTADALAWAWEHWDSVREMANPVGYLYRMAQTAARRHHRWRRRIVLPPEVPDEGPAFEPGLDVALARLSSNQRIAVVLVYGHSWSYHEAADALNISVSAVRNHLHRGLARLRRELGEDA